MNAKDLVALIHLVGFVTGVALYGMLAVMTWRAARRDGTGRGHTGRIPVLAAVLGLIWNAGALLVFGWHDFGLGELSPWLSAVSYAALGFLPAVVVDAATRSPQRAPHPTRIALFAYALSAAAAVMQVLETARGGTISTAGLLALTLGYTAIVLALAAMTRRRSGSQRAITAVALAAFAVSALHLSHHSTANDSWVVELIGHHASLPLVLVILYQDYRFALADLFLKRALGGLALVAMVVTVYALLWAPFGPNGARILPAGEPVMLLAAWIGTALLYPWLRSRVDRLVDRVILRRADYRDVRADISADLIETESPGEALDVGCAGLQNALTAGRVTWWQAADGEGARHTGTLVHVDGTATAVVTVPTAEPPAFTIAVGDLANGRRLLSDDLALLDSVAMVIARRIDELRVAQERLERDVREHEMQRLAAEAELNALRAQVNPHFLFNALTTIGFLIRTSPPRALDTLLQLTALLRAVLRRTSDFVTLGEEMQIVDAYLAIEQARFEDRLLVERDVPPAVTGLAVPPLILQPIVENAIKHGISPRRRGGTVRIHAAVETVELAGMEGRMLHLRVSDTGAGVHMAELARRRELGVGLSNVERRLDRYFGDRAWLAIDSTPQKGTTVDLFMPAQGDAMGGEIAEPPTHRATA